METDNNIPPNLNDNEILAPFVKYLVPGCVDLAPGEKLFVYRTQNIIPVDDYGESPRPKRKYGNEALKRKLTQAEVDALPENKRNKIIGDWGLSCNDSEDSAAQNFRFTYQSLKQKGASEADLQSFASERGIHICRFIITNETGLITPFDEHGHANLYLYEGVTLEKIRDKDYNYKTIEYKSDED